MITSEAGALIAVELVAVCLIPGIFAGMVTAMIFRVGYSGRMLLGDALLAAGGISGAIIVAMVCFPSDSSAPAWAMESAVTLPFLPAL